MSAQNKYDSDAIFEAICARTQQDWLKYIVEKHNLQDLNEIRKIAGIKHFQNVYRLMENSFPLMSYKTLAKISLAFDEPIPVPKLRDKK